MSSVHTRRLIFTLLWFHLLGRIISCSVPSYSSEITSSFAVTHRFISFAALILPISCRKIIPFSNQQVRREVQHSGDYEIYYLWVVTPCGRMFLLPGKWSQFLPSKGWYGLPDYTVFIPDGHSQSLAANSMEIDYVLWFSVRFQDGGRIIVKA